MKNLFHKTKIKEKILIVLLLSSGFCNTIFAQGTVKGLLINQHLQPIQNALVILQSIENPKTAQTVFSNDSGKFALSADTGYYHFNIYLGSKVLFDTTFNIFGKIDFGKIQVKDTLLSNKIKGIKIVGKRPQVTLREGKLIFTPTSVSAGNVIDILRHTPMVLVSQSSIGIVGKQGGTVVMINGRLKNMSGQVLMNYLRNISATDVASIEVQRTGFALQDAGDNSGIINIILKKKEKQSGIDGNFYLGYQQAHYASSYGGVTLNWYQKKTQWSNTIGYSYGNTLINGRNDVYYPFTTDFTTERQQLKSNALNYSSKLAYQINKQNYFEADLDLNLMPQKIQSHNQSIFKVNQHLQPDSSLIANNNNNQHLGQAGLTAYYKHQFDSAGNQMELTLNLIRYWFNRDQTVFNQYFDAQNQEIFGKANGIQSGNDQNLSLSTFNILFQHPGKWMNLKYGGKLTFISNHNHSDFYREVQEEWQPDFIFFDQYNYDEQTQALFIQGTKKNKKVGFSLRIAGGTYPNKRS